MLDTGGLARTSIWRRFGPLVLLAVALAGLSLWQIAAGQESLGFSPEEVAERPGFLPLGSSFGNACRATVWGFPQYLGLLVSPVGHCPDHLVAAQAVRVSAAWWGRLVFCLAWGGLVLRLAVKRNRLVLPMLWISVTLAFAVFPPFLLGRHIAVLSERYAYVASIGMAWLLVALAMRLPWKKAGWAALVAMGALFGGTTVAYLPHFASEEAFANRILACNPGAWHPYFLLGRLALSKGNPA